MMNQGATHAVPVLGPRLPCASSSFHRPLSRSKVRALIVASALSCILYPADLTGPLGGSTPPLPWGSGIILLPLPFLFVRTKGPSTPYPVDRLTMEA